MATATLNYLGGLKCEIKHENSGTKIITAAPLDNNGDGSSFSPTDLLASAYLSCMLTIIGIYCDKNGLQLSAASGSVTKVMGSGPRRVERLEIVLDLTGNEWSTDEKERIIRAAEACPVAKSVSEHMEVNVDYKFD